jgi:hypothetical protein
MTSSRPFAILALLGAAVMVAASAPAGASPSARPRLSTGMVIHGNGVTLVVPAPGHGVFGAAVRVNGDGQDWLGVMTGTDGTVVVYRRPVGQHASELAGTSACTDATYTTEGTTWAKRFDWSFNSVSTPAGLSSTGAETALKNSASRIETAYNDCGLADQVSATQSYLGTTPVGENIIKNATCGTDDGANVIGFGTLPVGVLAFTCWWTSGPNTIQADVRLNKSHYGWVTSTAGCTSKFMVAAAAIHELGHVFGLGHALPQASHPDLTMHPVIASCQNSESTLGLGDVLGLQSLY